jgi:hypothetical protein
LKPVASYQTKWLSVYGSSASGVVVLPANRSAFAFLQAFSSGLTASALALAPLYSA